MDNHPLPDGAAISGVIVMEHPTQVGVEVTRPPLLAVFDEHAIMRTGAVEDEAGNRAILVRILEEGSKVVRSGAPELCGGTKYRCKALHVIRDSNGKKRASEVQRASDVPSKRRNIRFPVENPSARTNKERLLHARSSLVYFICPLEGCSMARRNGRTIPVREARGLHSTSLGYLRKIGPHEEKLRSTDPRDTAIAIAFLRGGRSGHSCFFGGISGSFEAFSADFLAGDRRRPRAVPAKKRTTKKR